MVFFELIQPRAFPWNSARQPSQIDRVQSMGGDFTITQTKLYEMGRTGKLGVRKETPSLSYPITQLENASMDFWRTLANLEDPDSIGLDNSVDLDDLKTKMCEFSAYYTDDDKVTFKGTVLFPKVRVNGFSINVGDPDAIVERSFDLIGEDFIMLPGKYFSYETATVVAPGNGTVTLDPVAIEWADGRFVYRVLRVRAGVVSELIEDAGAGDDTWAYSAPTVTVQDCLAGDILKVYYPSATAYTTIWTDNDSDPDALYAEDCEISMKVGVGASARIYRLQSIGIDVAFERTDYKEIGNKQVVQTGVTGKTVTISLDRFNEGFGLEALLIDDATYPYDKTVHIDAREFADNIQVQLKVYKYVAGVRTFGIGYLATALSPTSIGATGAVEEYGKVTNSLEGSDLKISDDESEILFV